MRYYWFMAVAVLSACSPVHRSAAPPAVRVNGYELANGLWFDGERFLAKRLYVVDGTFTDRRPLQLDSVVDLQGGYVIPPFGDAHTHNLDGPQRLGAVRDSYLREGTFYVQVLTNSRSRSSAVRGQFNQPGALDVVYAHGGLTSTLSHPFQAYEPFALGIYDGSTWTARAEEIRSSRILENDAYWFIDTEADLEEKWPRILAGEPDIIKIFLLDAAGKAEGESHPWGGPGPGLSPALVPQIVRLAKDAGLRVAAHVETAHDAAIAIEAGADILAHLPGYAIRRDADARPYEIGEELARLAAQRQVIMMPNAYLVALYTAGDSVHREQAQALQRRNLNLLRRHGVPFVVGSDAFGRTARLEFYAMRDLGMWSNQDLLRTWAVATPQSIFPGRRIGRLEPGYEASLLVLDCDPLVRLECVENIRLRIKQGVPINVPPGSNGG